MSYDVWLETELGEVTDARNYTYNISPMLRLAWDGGSLTDLNGKTAKEALPFIEFAACMIANDANNRFTALNPPNGWGSREGCVRWLREIAHDCREWPEAIVRIG